MVRKLLLLAAICLCARAEAQNGQWEIYGGGSYTRIDVSPDLKVAGLDKINSYGWDTSVSEYINNWFGATADFSGMYARPTLKIAANAFGSGVPSSSVDLTDLFNTRAYTFMFGPSFAYRRNAKVQPFARMLIGGVRASADLTSKGKALLSSAGITTQVTGASKTRWGFAAGGGADIRINNLVSVRGQADWIRSTFPDFIATTGDDRQNNIRVSAGIVFRLPSTF